MADDPTRISLNAEDFKHLVSGHTLLCDGVEIGLQDIGWNEVCAIIRQVESSASTLCAEGCMRDPHHYGACIT